MMETACSESFYSLLEISENATESEIIAAYKKTALKYHPDKNRNQTIWSTEKFQKLIRAKNVLLDKYEKVKYDEELIKQGVRNPNAIALPCDICSNHRHYFQKRCLQGNGHKSPYWDEFEKAEKEFENLKKSEFSVIFENKLDEYLKRFTNEKLHKLVPLSLQKDPGDEELLQFTAMLELEVSKYLETFISIDINPLSKIVTSIFNDIGFFGSTYFLSDEQHLKLEAYTLLSGTLIKSSIIERLRSKQLSNNQDNLYDTSVLNLKELKILCKYFCTEFLKGASIDDLENKVKLVLKLESENARMPNSNYQNDSMECSFCHIKSRWGSAFWKKCFLCLHNFCSKCSNKLVKSKLPYLDMEIRSICHDCKTWFDEFQADNLFVSAYESILNNSMTLPTFIAVCDLAKLTNHKRAFCLKVDIMLAKQMLKHKEYKQFFAYPFCKTCKGNVKLEIFKLYLNAMFFALDECKTLSLSEKISHMESLIYWMRSQKDTFKEVILLGTTMKLDLVNKRDIEFKVHVNILNEEICRAINENSLHDLLDLLLIYDKENEVLFASLEKLNQNSSKINLNSESKLLIEICIAVKTFSKDPVEGMKSLGKTYWKRCATYCNAKEDIKLAEFISCLATHKTFSSARLDFFKNVEHISNKNFLTCLNIDEKDLLQLPCLYSNMNVEHLNTPVANIKMFKKLEASVNKLLSEKKWENIDVAFSYYDFIFASSSPSQFLITTLIAAQWFVKAMSSTHMIESKKYACKKMVLNLTSLAASLAFELGAHAYLQFYVAQKICALQFYAIKNAAYGLEPEKEAKTLCEHLEWLISSCRVCPILSLPCFIHSYEAVIFDIHSREAHCEYLFVVLNQEGTKRQLTEGILRYKIFENHFNGTCEVVEEFEDETKLNAMNALLIEQGYDWEGVQQLTNSNLYHVDNQGWLKINKLLLGPVKKDKICTVKGFSINKKSNDIDLILGKSFLTSILFRKDQNTQPLLCWQDIATSILMSSPVCVFSLDGINQRETNYHPFNQYFFMPDELDGTEFLSTLFHTDYLLKQFSMGEEISLVPPFKHRSIYNGLLKDLPREIQEILKPIHLRGFSKSRVHRLWIQADEMDFDVKEDNEKIIYLFGDIKMSVRCMPMFYDDCGGLQDQNELDPNSPESQFASDFSANYEKIGKFFPEFLRLKELCKVQRLGQLLDIIKETKTKEIEKLSDPNNKELNMQLEINLKQAINNQISHLESVFKNIYYEVRKQGIDEDVICQVRSSINSKFDISTSYSDVSDWLYYNNADNIITQIMVVKKVEIKNMQKKSLSDLINEQKNQLKAFQDKIDELKKVSKEKLLPLKPKNGCKWVPAVCHSKDERIRYGGVSLCPKLKHTELTVNNWMTSTVRFNVPAISNIHKNGFVAEVFQPSMSSPIKQSSLSIGTNFNGVNNKKCGSKKTCGGSTGGGTTGSGGSIGDEGNNGSGSYRPQDVLPNYGIVKIKKVLNSLGLDHKQHRFIGNNRDHILQYEKTDLKFFEVLKKLEDLFQLKPEPKNSDTGGKIWIFPLNYGLTEECNKRELPSVIFSLRENSGEGRPTLDVSIDNAKYTKKHASDEIKDKINNKHLIKVRIGVKDENKAK